MPYRPLTDRERDLVQGKIEAVKKEISAREVYLSALLQELEQGRWYMDYKRGTEWIDE